MSYHSTPINGDPGLKDLEQYIGATSFNLMTEWGYDIQKYQMYFTEFWVQEFSKNGGGHHSTHVHWDNHISGFYFLKCSDKTSYPVMHDPRAGAAAAATAWIVRRGRARRTLQELEPARPQPGSSGGAGPGRRVHHRRPGARLPTRPPAPLPNSVGTPLAVAAPCGGGAY